MILFLAIAALVVVLDYITKWVVVRELPFTRDVHVIGDWVMLTHIKNTGAAFGLFPGNIIPLIVISVGASVVVCILAMRAGNRFSRVLPLGLILGGAIGNLIDRIGQGRVTDFVNIGVPGGPRWPVFNVADSAVTIGVAILAFGVYFRSGADERSEAKEKRGAAEGAAVPEHSVTGEPHAVNDHTDDRQATDDLSVAGDLTSTSVSETRQNALPGESG